MPIILLTCYSFGHARHVRADYLDHRFNEAARAIRWLVQNDAGHAGKGWPSRTFMYYYRQFSVAGTLQQSDDGASR